MAWYQFHIKFEEDKKEILNAFLISAEADAILDNGDHFICYKENIDDPNVFLAAISHLPGVKGKIEYSICEDKNWNADWESNYDPIAIENICYIRAEFHEPNSSYSKEILIRPQMAFGTGHHETTYMMITMMDQLDFENKRVLDYGCGTGILSVFAAIKNAGPIKGIDIEKPAVENSYIHREINNLSDFPMEFELGGLEVLGNQSFDVILANINRGVLLQTKEQILEHLNPKGLVLMSGILKTDENLILEKYSPSFELLDTNEKGEWLCFLWKAKT